LDVDGGSSYVSFLEGWFLRRTKGNSEKGAPSMELGPIVGPACQYCTRPKSVLALRNSCLVSAFPSRAFLEGFGLSAMHKVVLGPDR
jgi:hypothetical protein